MGNDSSKSTQKLYLDDELSAATKCTANRCAQQIDELLNLSFKQIDSIFKIQTFLLSQCMHSLIPCEERTRIVFAQSRQELLQICSGKFSWYDSMALEELFEFIQTNCSELKEIKCLKDEILEGIRQFFEGVGRIIKDPLSGCTILMVDSYLRQCDSDGYVMYKLYHLAVRALSLENEGELQILEAQHKKNLTPENYSHIDKVGNSPTRVQHKTCVTKWRSSLGDSISDVDAIPQP